MKERIEDELKLLRTRFSKVEYREEGHWFLLPEYPAPAGMWTNDAPSICFQVPTGYPGQKPYAFYVRQPFALGNGAPVNNIAASSEPPFDGEWLKFSWDMPDWRATDDLASGYNLLNWTLSFQARLQEGA